VPTINFSTPSGEKLPREKRGDFATALIEWKPLAEQGFAKAQHNLGFMYAQGQGVTQDFTLIHMWWNIAASLGIKIAVESLGIVENEMTPTQIEEAQELARKCIAKNYKDC